MDQTAEGTEFDRDRALDGALDTDSMITACQQMVRIPSLSGEESEAAAAMVDCLRALDYDRVDIDDKGNVLGWLDGEGNGPTLLVNGHLDHVPPGDMIDPYGGRLVDAARWNEPGMAIVGRGSCDMKCNVVAAAFGLAAIKRAGIRLAGTVILNADVGEEVDSPDGVQHLLARGLRADFGLSVEATGMNVYLGHRGKVEFELRVHGRMAHSSEPSRGDNAIARALPLLAALERRATILPPHPLLGQATLAVIDIGASPGGGVAVVPDRCTVRVDRRYIPGETPETLYAEMAEIVDAIGVLDSRFHCDIEEVNHYPLFFTDPEHPLVEIARAARADILDDRGYVGAWRFGVNGTFMARAGIPTVGFGPGNERWAHTPDEHVLVDELITAARIYGRLALRVCGVASPEWHEERSDGQWQ
ncbi:MAG: M20/M25/M40 family metallo-hydrolase [Thermomicrobiales bacterium]|nr:M20/M25/M40 family metallo-hydrolase [Thermomicrobiales bacterium]